jgi:hypothetical protein
VVLVGASRLEPRVPTLRIVLPEWIPNVRRATEIASAASRTAATGPAVSAVLVGVGLAVAWALRSGRRLAVARWHWGAGLAGGFLVVLSFTLDAGRLIDGGLPGPYAWPVFAVGMLVALAAAVDTLRAGSRSQPERFGGSGLSLGGCVGNALSRT